MDMDVNKLGAVSILSDYQTHNSRLVKAMDRLVTGKKVNDVKDDPRLWGEVEGLRQRVTILAGFSDNLNRAAASVRVAIDSMDASRAHIFQAKERLNQAFEAKPGSLERANALKDYNVLVGLIDEVAEAPDDGARRLLDSPSNFPDAGSIDISAGEDGYIVTLNAQEIHTGMDGLDLPRAGEARPSDLDADPLTPPIIADINNATNEEIKQMLEFVALADETLIAKNKALSVDAGSIEDSERFNQAFIQRNKALVESIDAVDLRAEAAITRSLEIKTALALNGLGTVNSTYELSLQLLR